MRMRDRALDGIALLDDKVTGAEELANDVHDHLRRHAINSLQHPAELDNRDDRNQPGRSAVSSSSMNERARAD